MLTPSQRRFLNAMPSACPDCGGVKRCTCDESGPSDKAVEHAANIIARSPRKAVYEMADTLAACAGRGMHDPRLGLDRSVCLRDVVESLKDVPAALIFIERKFGGES